MKKQSLILLTVTALFLSNFCFAQSDKRYVVEMKIDYKGKTVQIPITSVSYSVTKDDVDTTISKDNIYNKYIYVNITPLKITKEFAELIADKQPIFNASITITDSYGKYPAKEMILKNARVYSFSESASSYDYDAQAGSYSVSINAGSVVTNGVEIFP